MTGGLIGVVFVLNALILAYAIHVSRPSSSLPGPPAAAAPAAGVRLARTAPVIPGLHNDHPLAAHERGDVLIAELNCTACHATPQPRLEARQAPDLSTVGGRVDPAFLRAFIADPAAVDPGTTMPDMLGERTADERLAIAADIAAFLVDRSTMPFDRTVVDPELAADGTDLFHEIGCVACHAPRDADGGELDAAGVVPLAHVGEKYSLASLTDFLFQPLEVRPSGRMPDMTLSREEARAIASALLVPVRAPAAPPAMGDPERGRRHFIELDCAACHALPDLPDPIGAAPLAALDADRGCLENAAGHAPDFHLDAEQARAIRAALSAPATPVSDESFIAMTLTGFNCFACHERDGAGGVSTARDRFFTTSEPSLGNEARIPPQLTGLGAKLRTEWLQRVLFDAETVRPYMHVRMPQFGESNLRRLPAVVARVDRVEPVERPTLEGDVERAHRDAGRLLVGDKGLNCVSCHGFAGKASPGFNGIDLLTSVERLRPDWFHHFLRSPGTHRPGITMPTYWAGGVANRDDILEGDVNGQIHAIWHYLSLGQSARLPDGIQAIPSHLLVTNETRTYRGRSRVAGYRGIAVGFPEHLNYAFNAKNGTLSALWRGDFVRVNWSGQGAGDFNPASRPIQLAQDVSFITDLGDREWPLRPVMTDENPVDPDPLYPRNHGYAFEGYFFDEAFIPTFMYRCGDVAIEDRTAPEMVDDRVQLARTLAFTAPGATTLTFRVLTGSIESTGPSLYEIPRLRIRVPATGGRAALRPTAPDGGQELLFTIPLQEGRSTVTIHYELLD